MAVTALRSIEYWGGKSIPSLFPEVPFFFRYSSLFFVLRNIPQTEWVYVPNNLSD